MSPGATFERVYRELKQQLAGRQRPPGSPIEPTMVGTELAASITPVRDALHRLVGERLVEAPDHNGFRVPQLTEAGLRDLYRWHGEVLGLAVSGIRNPRVPVVPLAADSHAQVPAAVSELFLGLARTTGSTEHARTVAQLGDRLAPYRHVEGELLDAFVEEYAGLVTLVELGEAAPLRRALTLYHRRRAGAVAAILESLSARS
jgi:hypothetical protein